MIPRTWQRQLEEAKSEPEVLDVAHAFVATLSRGDWERLPPHCRPGILGDRDDIERYAYVLVSHHCAGDAATERIATRLAAFFSAAAARLREI